MLAGPDGPQAARAEGYLQALAERGLKADIVNGAEFNEVGGRMRPRACSPGEIGRAAFSPPTI